MSSECRTRARFRVSSLLVCFALVACERAAEERAAPLAPQGLQHVDVTVPEAVDRAPSASAAARESTLHRAAEAPIRQAPAQELLRVSVTCEESVTGPIELYVLDPDSYDVARHKDVMRALGNGEAWRIVEEFATRLDVVGVPLDGGTTFEIPRPGRRATVIARMGDVVGRRSMVRASEGTLAIAMDGRRLVEREVFVRDAGGRPVEGVSVGVIEYAAGDDLWRNAAREVAAAKTDELGRAIVVAPAADVVAYALTPGVGFAAADVADPFVVVLPETGSVLVSVRDATIQGTVSIAEEFTGANGTMAQIHGVQPTVLFEGLRLGATYVVRLHATNRSVGEQRVRGPEAPGEQVVVMLDPLPLASLRLRLVDESGGPLPRLLVDVECGGRRFDSVRSDEDGVVHIALDPAQIEPRQLRSLKVRDSGRARSKRQGEADVQSSSIEGVIEGGDVALRNPRLVVAGRIVDPDGAPIERATVELFKGLDPSGEVLSLGGGPGPHAPPIIAGTRQVTGPDGAFEMLTAERVESSDMRMFLRVKAPRHARVRALRFREGDTGLVVTLDRPGELTADTSTIPRSVADQLSLEVHDELGALIAERELGAVVLFDRLRPGTYSLHLNLSWYELACIDGLVVPAAGSCSDPRLTPVRFSTPIGAREYTLVSPTGASISEPATVRYWIDEEVIRCIVAARDGQLAVVDAPPISRTAVSVEGYAAVEVTGRPAGERIELVPELSVQLAFVGALSHVEGLGVSVLREGSDLPSPHLDRFDALGPDRTLSRRLPGPGRYVAELRTEEESFGRHPFEVRADTTRVELEVQRKGP